MPTAPVRSTGLQGDPGPQGPPGSDGEQGPVGPQGPQGLKGDTGPSGINGSDGPMGSRGPQGFTGDTGAKGDTGLQGDTGATGPAGNDGQSDKNYLHNQLVANALWTVTHNLGKFPSVVVIDSAGTVVVGDVQYINTNTLLITFTASFAGKATLN